VTSDKIRASVWGKDLSMDIFCAYFRKNRFSLFSLNSINIQTTYDNAQICTLYTHTHCRHVDLENERCSFTRGRCSYLTLHTQTEKVVRSSTEREPRTQVLECTNGLISQFFFADDKSQFHRSIHLYSYIFRKVLLPLATRNTKNTSCQRKYISLRQNQMTQTQIMIINVTLIQITNDLHDGDDDEKEECHFCDCHS